jgi:hypothetical protein
MHCIRCNGFMMCEMPCDAMDAAGCSTDDSLRCVNCGNVEDDTIRANRIASRPAAESATRPRLARAVMIGHSR